MYSDVKLNNVGFCFKVTDMGKAGDNIEGSIKLPEITANMKTLQKYLESYSKISDVLDLYKTLIEEDVRQLKSVQEAFIFADSRLLK